MHPQNTTMKTILKAIISQVSKHNCIWLTIFFVLFIGFFDSNSVVRRFELLQTNDALRDEISKYEAKYAEDTRELEKLDNSPEAVERVARMKLLMKSNDEDIYIVSH